MILEHFDPSTGAPLPPTDTDKLPDMEAMILEKANELRKLCFDANRLCCVVIDIKGECNGKAVSFWNYKCTKFDNAQQTIPLLMTMINQLIFPLTQGWFRIVNTPPYQPPPPPPVTGAEIVEKPTE